MSYKRAAIGNAVDGTTAADASGAGCHQGGRVCHGGQVEPREPMHGGAGCHQAGRWYHGNRCTAAGYHQAAAIGNEVDGTTATDARRQDAIRAGNYRQRGRRNHGNRCTAGCHQGGSHRQRGRRNHGSRCTARQISANTPANFLFFIPLIHKALYTPPRPKKRLRGSMDSAGEIA